MKETKRSNTWLSDHARSVTSQAGEDGIIEKVLEVIARPNRWCVEFGSWDGKHLSNTWNLIANHSFSAVLIEGDKKRHQTLRNNFLENPKVIPVCAFVGFEPEEGLDRILEKTPIPADFDLLSIDIDGNDYHVWQAVRKYRPKVVIIEFNPTVPPVVRFVQPRDMSVTQGCGLTALVDLAGEKGYELVAVESANAVFVDQTYFPLFEIEDNSIQALWTRQTALTHLFFGYDGTVFIRGLTRHPWTSVPIEEEKLQILPKWARKRFGKQNPLIRNLAKFYRRRLKRKRAQSAAKDRGE